MNNAKETVWQSFADTYALSPEHIEQFKTYAAMLNEWNNTHNITRISQLEEVISYHFADSLALTHFIDCTTIQALADVGSGGGFPGIPLAIKYPHLSVTLIEVNLKKGAFLQSVIDALGLTQVTVSSLDWRTFIRSMTIPIDLFISRASLHTDELIRIFRPGCRYQGAQLVYWASCWWKISPFDKPYLKQLQEYHVGDKQRVLAFFAQK